MKLYKMRLTLHNFDGYDYTYNTYIGNDKKDLLKIYLNHKGYFDICEYEIEEITENPCLINTEWKECW